MRHNLTVLEYDCCEKLRRIDDDHDELVRRISERIMRCIFAQICIIETNHSEFNHIVDKLLITSLNSITNGLLCFLWNQCEWQASHIFWMIFTVRISYTMNLS